MLWQGCVLETVREMCEKCARIVFCILDVLERLFRNGNVLENVLEMSRAKALSSVFESGRRMLRRGVQRVSHPFLFHLVFMMHRVSHILSRRSHCLI